MNLACYVNVIALTSLSWSFNKTYHFKKSGYRICPLTIVMVTISSGVHLKASIIFQVTDSRLCKPCREPHRRAISTIHRSFHTELVSVPKQVCYDDHTFRLGVLIGCLIVKVVVIKSVWALAVVNLWKIQRLLQNKWWH